MQCRKGWSHKGVTQMLVTTFTSPSNVATDRYDHHHHHHHHQGGNDDNDDDEYTGIEGSEEEEFH